MKDLTILIPTSRNPDLEDRPLQNIKNILVKLKEKCRLRIVWVNFNSKRIIELKNKEFEVINFHDYSNAFQVLDEIKPDFILLLGWLEFKNSAFSLAGKIMKIPVVAIFMLDLSLIDSSTKSSIFNKRMRILFKKKQRSITGRNEHESSSKLFKLITEYWFFIKTIQKIHANILQKLNYILSFPKALLTKIIPPPDLINGDLNLCYNPKIKNKLIENGFVESKIFVTGDPYFDHIIQESLNVKSRIIKNSKIKILFCPVDMHESGLWKKEDEHKLIIDSIKTIQSNNEFEIAVKIHPFRSSKEEYEHIFKKNKINITIYQNEEVTDLIQKHDMLITYGTSAIALYGIILQKPVLFLHFSDKNQIPVYFDKNISTICNSNNELKIKIKESIQKEITIDNSEKYFEKHLGQYDGKSSERAANAILNMLNKN